MNKIKSYYVDNIYDIHWLEQNHFIAFSALPECYQNDNCLDFWFEDKYLKAAPMKSQEFALGCWNAYYNHKKEEWLFDGR